MTMQSDRQPQPSHAESQARWDLAMQCAGFGIWDLDVDSETVNFSPAWKELLGYEAPDIKDSTAVWRGRVHPDDLQGMMVALNTCIAGPADDYEHEFRLRAADARYRCVLSRGRVVERNAEGVARRMIGTMTDLSDRRSAEALRMELDRSQAASRAKTEFLARMSHELRTPLNAVLGFAQLLDHVIGSPDTEMQRNYVQQIQRSGWSLLQLIDETLAMAKASADLADHVTTDQPPTAAARKAGS